MGVATPISVAEYLHTSYRPDCDFVDGYILERHAGRAGAEVTVYLAIAVPNIWVIDPWKRRAWIVTARGWQAVTEGAIQTVDGLSTLPISELML